MPRKKETPYWRERVKAVLSEHDGKISDRKVLQRLKAEAERLKNIADPQERQVADNLPSERTINRIRIGEWLPLTPPERAQYRSFSWPESMERGDLPWEASASALELLRFLDAGGRVGERPPIRFVKWFWRVSQAAPGCGMHGRVMAASILTSYELSGKRVPVRGLEWWLAYRPWDGETHMKSYREATRRAENPIPEFDASVTLSESEAQNESEMLAWMEWLFNKSLAGSSRATFFWTMMPDDVDRKIVRSEETNG